LLLDPGEYAITRSPAFGVCFRVGARRCARSAPRDAALGAHGGASDLPVAGTRHGAAHGLDRGARAGLLPRDGGSGESRGPLGADGLDLRLEPDGLLRGDLALVGIRLAGGSLAPRRSRPAGLDGGRTRDPHAPRRPPLVAGRAFRLPGG